jgi:RimJ/RimL family protein N-acetyltransferase
MNEAVFASDRSVRLRRFTSTDITAEYIGWLNDPVVVRFSNQRFRRHDAASCASYLATFAKSDNLFVAVELADTGRMIGTMTAYTSRHHGTADMGLLIGDRAVWGRGLGLAAWSALMNHLFEACALRKVTGGAVRCNAGMIRILERSGMHHEATRVKQEIVEGEPQDVVHFAKFR